MTLTIRKFNTGQFTADEPQAGIGMNRPELSFSFGGAMSKANPDDFGRHQRLEKRPETALDRRAHETPERSKLLACLLIVPSDAEPKCVLARGDDAEEIIRRIADFRTQDKPNPEYYARHTVMKAQAELSRQRAVEKPAEGHQPQTKEIGIDH